MLPEYHNIFSTGNSRPVEEQVFGGNDLFQNVSAIDNTIDDLQESFNSDYSECGSANNPFEQFYGNDTNGDWCNDSLNQSVPEDNCYEIQDAFSSENINNNSDSYYRNVNFCDFFSKSPEWNEQQLDILDDMQGFEKLKIQEWNQTSPDEQLQVLQNLSDQCARIQGIEPVAVELADLEEGNAGGYAHNYKTIFLNATDFLNCDTHTELSEMRDTVLHETFHAYQHQCTENPLLHNNRLEVEVWRENFKPGNYITPEQDIVAYATQPVEKTASYFANIHNQQIEKVLANPAPLSDISENIMEFLKENHIFWEPLIEAAARNMKNIF